MHVPSSQDRLVACKITFDCHVSKDSLVRVGMSEKYAVQPLNGKKQVARRYQHVLQPTGVGAALFVLWGKAEEADHCSKRM